MIQSSNQDKQIKLSAEFPYFIYEEFTCSLEPEGLKMNFHFNLGGSYHFYPTLFIPRKNWAFPDDILYPAGKTRVFDYTTVPDPATEVAQKKLLSDLFTTVNLEPANTKIFTGKIKFD